MYGSAPYTSRTTSHWLLKTNESRPVWASIPADNLQSAKTMTRATAKTATPRMVSSVAHAWSAKFLRVGSAIRMSRPSRRAASVSLAGCKDCLSLDGHLFQGAFHAVHHQPGERGIIEESGGLLPVVDGPPEELQQRVPLGGVRLVPVDENVGEGRNRIGVLALRIGDRHPVVVRHLHRGSRLGNGLQRRLHPRPVAILESRRDELVLIGVCKLDVSDRAVGLLDRPGHALVALATQSDRPIDALAGPRSSLPFR